jgi:hypothetical protein
MKPQRDSLGRFVKGNHEGNPFPPGKSGNPAGRPPLPSNVIKSMPRDARVKAYDALWTAMSLPDIASAKEYLEKAAEDMPECGLVLQVAAKALSGPKGWEALMDIYDRLFGKPKQTTEIEGGLNLTPPAVIIEGEEDDG